jgi:hypothetical protein
MKYSYEEFIQGYLTYEEFVRAHSLAPLVDVKTACFVANVGHSRFYELVKNGAFVLIPNGARRNVSAQNLHQYYLALIEKAQSAPKMPSKRAQASGQPPMIGKIEISV